MSRDFRHGLAGFASSLAVEILKFSNVLPLWRPLRGSRWYGRRDEVKLHLLLSFLAKLGKVDCFCGGPHGPSSHFASSFAGAILKFLKFLFTWRPLGGLRRYRDREEAQLILLVQLGTKSDQSGFSLAKMCARHDVALDEDGPVAIVAVVWTLDSVHAVCEQ